MINELKVPDYSDLIRIYGAENVESACILIVTATDPKGLKVAIPPTVERVEAVLDAVHGEYLLSWLKKYA